MIMNGYLGLDEKTRDCFTADGWYKTGDLGKVDTDGYWYITGRMKDQDVLSSGKKVQTGPIKEMLKTNDFIDQAVLCGHERPVEGAVIAPKWHNLEKWAAAQGIPTSDHKALIADERVQKHYKAEVKKMCAKLSDYEQVKVIVLSPESFTESNGLTTTGGLKIKRPAVLKHFEAEINAAYSRGKG
jgi:long-chain acyl-CoA synthetase